MSIRTAIARWLDPDTFRTARRYQYLRGQLEDAARWLGYEFPEVDAAIRWAKVADVNHFRRLDEPSVPAVPGKPWIWSISDFREHLRSERGPAAEGSPSSGSASLRAAGLDEKASEASAEGGAR